MKVAYFFFAICLLILSACGEDDNGIAANPNQKDNNNTGQETTVNVSFFNPEFQSIGKNIKLYGSGFGEDKSILKVFFDDASAEIISITNFTIEVVVPKGIKKICEITIEKNNKKYTYKKDFYLKSDVDDFKTATVKSNGILMIDSEENYINLALGFTIGNRKTFYGNEYNFEVDTCVNHNGQEYQLYYLKYMYGDSKYYEIDTMLVSFTLDNNNSLLENVQIKYKTDYAIFTSYPAYRKVKVVKTINLSKIPYLVEDGHVIAKLDEISNQGYIQNVLSSYYSRSDKGEEYEDILANYKLTDGYSLEIDLEIKK